MNARRYYCPVELAVDVIGSKWAVVVLAHLKEREHRYGELRRRSAPPNRPFPRPSPTA